MDIAQLINNQSEEHTVEWQGITLAFRWHPGLWTNALAPEFVGGDSDLFIKHLAELLSWWDLTEVVPAARGEKPDPMKTRPLPINEANVRRLPIPVLNRAARVILEDVVGSLPNPEASPPTSSPEASSELVPNGTAS